MNATSHPPHGIIIGGGIGGACLAAALERVGISCEVHEQANELPEVGAGLGVWSKDPKLLQSDWEVFLCIRARVWGFCEISGASQP